MGKTRRDVFKSKSANRAETPSHCKKKNAAAATTAAVQVVVCPSSFPDFNTIGQKPAKTSSTYSSLTSLRLKQQTRQEQKYKNLDFHQTIHEIKQLACTNLNKHETIQYQREQYKHLTGREMKRHYIPLPILRGMKQKAKERQERKERELRECGIVHASSSSSSFASFPKNNGKNQQKKGDTNTSQALQQRKKDKRIHGPAPNVGFMKGGVLRVSKK